MKKKLIIAAICCFGFLELGAQTPCVGGRYNVKAFSVDTLVDVIYGQNVNSTGLIQDLKCDIFLPKADSCSARPVLVLAHGGTFLVGNKDIIDVKVLANEFAKRGYVCISMNYRLGIKIIGGGTLQEEFSAAVWRGMQDGRAMIRYLRRSADKLSNPYAIDTNSIYLGGASAGAVLALYVAFVDLPSEIPTYIDTTSLGGITGSSGSAGYSSEVKGVISLCGGMPIDLSPMNNNTLIPLLNVHGTRDNVVPYKCDSFDFVGINVEWMCGSFSIDSVARLNGNPSTLYTMIGESHVPWLNSNGIQFIPSKKFLFDSVEVLMEEFLYDQVVGYPFEYEFLNPFEIKQVGHILSIESESRTSLLEIIDLSGRVLWRESIVGKVNTLQIPGRFEGLVLLKLESEKGTTVKKIYLESSP